MRDLFSEALRMKIAEKPPEEIRAFLERQAVALGMTAGSAGDRSYEIRLVATGEVIAFDGTDYSYRRG
jgi:hypothetical protein